MGLLDGFLGNGWDDPKSQAVMALAGGLLNGDFGAGVTGYGSVMGSAKDKEIERRFKQAQMDNYMSEIEQRKAAIQKQAFIQDFLQKKLMGDGTSGAGLTQAPRDIGMGGNGLSFAGVGGNAGGASPIPASSNPGGLENMTPNDLAALKLNGVDLTDVYKLTRPNLTNVNGTMVDSTDPRNNNRFFANPDNGKNFNPATGVVSVLPNFLATQDAIEGGKAEAQERAKAKYDPITYTPAGSSTPILSTRGRVISGDGYAGGSPSAAVQGQLEILQQELRKPGISPADVSSIQREIARISQSNGIPVQSEAEKQRLIKTAEADVVRDTANKADSKRYNQFSSSIDRAIELLKAGPTGSGVGSVIDSGLGVIGLSTKGGNAASQLDTLSGWLTSNVPRMEGPQSNFDVTNYQTMAGLVGDRSKPIETRMAAAMEVKRLQEKYAELNGYQSPEKKPEAQKFNMLPPASQFAGKRMKSDDGKIYRSDGNKWIME